MRLRPLGVIVLGGVALTLGISWLQEPSAAERPLALAPGPAAEEAPRAPAPASGSLLELREVPETLDVGPGEVGAAELARAWARARGLVCSVDPQIENVKVRFDQPVTLDHRSLRDVLDHHDVVLVRGGGDALQAHRRRNLAQRVPSPWEQAGDEPVDPDRYISRAVQVHHGAANAIFATVRGLLTRDTNRIGNILYVQGPQRIILTDLAHNVRYYEEVIRSLDRPAPRDVRRARVAALRVGAAAWRDLRGQDAAEQVAALDELAATGDADVLADLTLVLGAGEAGAEVARPSGAELRVQERRDGLRVTATPADDDASRRSLHFGSKPAGEPRVQAAMDPDSDGYLVVVVR